MLKYVLSGAAVIFICGHLYAVLMRAYQWSDGDAGGLSFIIGMILAGALVFEITHD